MQNRAEKQEGFVADAVSDPPGTLSLQPGGGGKVHTLDVPAEGFLADLAGHHRGLAPAPRPRSKVPACPQGAHPAGLQQPGSAPAPGGGVLSPAGPRWAQGRARRRWRWPRSWLGVGGLGGCCVLNDGVLTWAGGREQPTEPLTWVSTASTDVHTGCTEKPFHCRAVEEVAQRGGAVSVLGDGSDEALA